MKKEIIDNCHICGKLKGLSWEHIPPKSSGNKITIKYYTADELLAKDVLSGETDLNNKRFHLSQNGLKMQTICDDCNNVTGSYYVPAYSNLSNLIRYALSAINQIDNLNKSIKIQCKVKPLNFLKEVIAMFCSILPQYTVNLYKFGDYVLNKEQQDFENNNFDIYMYWSTTIKGYYKYIPITGIFNPYKGYTGCSEISAPPLGFILSLKPDTKIKLPSLKKMKDFKYDEVVELSFSTQLLRPIGLLPMKYENNSIFEF